MYSYYTSAHGEYSRLDRILLANDGSLTVPWAANQVRILSDHAPLVLECETCTPRPPVASASKTLGNPEYRINVLTVLQAYIRENWNMAQTHRYL
ncbi:hypothetical protein NDU88_004933 [Pleurodeles waltl]|uniref:Endonuclease/exonuclease/phosphatase domain-containing protein n=1 Tax=Pleurodeles waltl TaxID=8319 RepID=A0AAV7LQS7_PLEWA|nr:hypothetical protein NDU88_004933 [Pleurodeles waltl]